MKKQQHYIWQHYLRNWANDKDQVYFFQKGEIKITNTKNVGQENYFYEFEPLTYDELNVLDSVIPPLELPRVNDFHNKWIGLFALMSQLFSEESLRNMNTEKLREIDEFQRTAIEDLHTKIEDSAKKYLADLSEGKCEFVSDPEEYFFFLFFLCHQYSRTKKSQERISSNLKGTKTIDPKKIWRIVCVIMGSHLAFNMFIHKEHFNFTVFQNDLEDHPFLTGDQPVVFKIFSTDKRNPKLSNVLVS